MSGTLLLYRLAGTLGTPFIDQHLRKRCRTGREDPERLRERYGEAGVARPTGPLLWCHGASVGEALSALPLLQKLRPLWPGPILMTTGTVTSARLMSERLPDDIIHQFAPIDHPRAVQRFLQAWRPSLAIIIEQEFWPNLLTMAHKQGIELALVNGRISEGSYRSWLRVKPLVQHLLGLFSIVLAQSPEDEAFFRSLGAARVESPGNLKFAAAPPAADAYFLAELEQQLGGRPRWLAASTHPGEEAEVARVHRKIARTEPRLVTLIAPRHPVRGEAIARTLRNEGLRVSQRSAREPITDKTEVYLADTIGEMGLWYRLCPIVFVGGSLVPKGGQNPLEAAKLNCSIVVGPHMSNFRRITAELIEQRGVFKVADADGLAHAIEELLAEPAKATALARVARTYASTQTVVLDRVVEALQPVIRTALQNAA